MLLHIPKVLTEAQVAHCRAIMEDAKWVDGRETSGHLAARVKHNRQVDEATPEAREMGNIMVTALERTPLFMAAALPLRVFPPLFNRYEPGMAFGAHVDNAIREYLNTNLRIRTDISATLFISSPEDYDGGELVVEDTYGSHHVKLPAGDLIVYPGTSLHNVTPITRGSRIASFFWTQSLIRDDGKRGLLFDLDMSIRRLTADHPEHKSIVSLTAVYHNLLRQWAEV